MYGNYLKRHKIYTLPGISTEFLAQVMQPPLYIASRIQLLQITKLFNLHIPSPLGDFTPDISNPLLLRNLTQDILHSLSPFRNLTPDISHPLPLRNISLQYFYARINISKQPPSPPLTADVNYIVRSVKDPIFKLSQPQLSLRSHSIKFMV